jgi:hypothetical protein
LQRSSRGCRAGEAPNNLHAHTGIAF